MPYQLARFGHTQLEGCALTYYESLDLSSPVRSSPCVRGRLHTAEITGPRLSTAVLSRNCLWTSELKRPGETRRPGRRVGSGF